jgi:hypothetical protein
MGKELKLNPNTKKFQHISPIEFQTRRSFDTGIHRIFKFLKGALGNYADVDYEKKLNSLHLYLIQARMSVSGQNFALVIAGVSQTRGMPLPDSWNIF